ncbi:GNAT family N-acetyltransferase [Rhizobium sp. WSM4643]|uniref:GNAT family N-acetyltransferase n=1 Tax=Rhizobium sp. WSM4643 TaxID=3138253 RepID=UPI003F8834B9
MMTSTGLANLLPCDRRRSLFPDGRRLPPRGSSCSAAAAIGIGNSLIKATLDTARRMRCRRLVLDTMPAMTSAIAAYEALGFQRINPYWNNILPVIYYGKTL